MQIPPDCCRPVGPTSARIMFVGEAPGQQEELTGMPFIGAAGQEFNRLLEEAGLARSATRLTNLLHCRPPDNKFTQHFCVSKKEAKAEDPSYDHQPIEGNKYLHPALLPALERLRTEIEEVRPNLVVALGGKATWALLGSSKITKLRGVATESSLVRGQKVLPTFHPSYVLRDWSLRTIVLTDLLKAKREAGFPEIRRPQRLIYLDPTIEDLAAWHERLSSASLLGIDTETKWRQITCVGFAPNPSEAYVIPFVDRRQPDASYWREPTDEVKAWRTVRALCQTSIPKVFQNGLYDIQYFMDVGIRPRAFIDDTMILHHALFPEMKKDLGFLGSVYLNEASWKLMRQRGEEVLKRDE